MKALKEAIELLKFFKDRKNTKITTMIKVQSCIAELEALQQRSCEGCKYSTKVFSYVYPLCTRDEQYPFQIHNKEVLACRFHEAKEQ